MMAGLRLDKPLIIWTLQRTGGTNLSKFLNRISDYEKSQDEPFNPRRQFGEVTRDWKAGKDQAALDNKVADILGERFNIKHCVEKVPYAVSVALAEQSLETAYQHLFLYRQDPLGRLLSMEYAERTDIWGPRPNVDAPERDVFDAPLNVDGMIRHEKRSHFRLNETWRILNQGGRVPGAISFEELYQLDFAQAAQALARAFDRISLQLKPAQTEKVLTRLRDRGDQKTADRYAKFKGVDDLKKHLRDVPPLVFGLRSGRVS